ncbi:MAG: acyl-CoA dehydrogenase family protein [Candidatus Rokubacteria bacterium]|nr:acyl-CoA dehydrogenase family protein [Candidatus Rokubacteria bacterium]
MEFGPNDAQRLFERLVRKLLADHLPMDALHRLANAGSGFDDRFWSALTELGVAGVLVPERFGGAGLGVFEAALAAEALGYHAAPTPFAAAAVMAPLAILGAGSEAARAAWLPRVATGTARLGVAFETLAGSTANSAVERRGDRLSGCLESVVDLAGATHVLVVLDDGTLAVLPVDGPGVRAACRPSLDRTRPPGQVHLADAPAEILEPGSDPQRLACSVVDAGRTMLAADTLGAAQSMLDRAVAHAGQREQFGRLIGSFQAVKHMCADMVAMLEPCRSLVWYAAHAQDAIPEEARVAACHAKAHLAEVGREVSRMATEVHGGMGFTDELGLHYWFKRIGANRQLLGGPERCRQEAAAAQGWSTA